MQDDSEGPGAVKRQRAVNATDSEWDRIRERASAARMSASGYVVQRALAPEKSPGPSLETIAARLDGIETAVLTLAEVERMRLAERGEDDGWTAALRKVELRLRTERAISGEAGGLP